MIFKCKMCGGDIEIIKGTNTGKCLYCKSVMTLPEVDNEKILNLYNRANDLRLNNDFDKAYGIYETILELDNEQVEAHWGLLLCKYGVEYVDDEKTGKKIPTCHRTIPTSILKDKEFEIIRKKSYGDALKLYESEGKIISDIQKKILEISSKEEPYDIFICYKETDENNERTKDSVIAQDIYDKLVEKNYKVFFARITLEDKLGLNYEPYIYSALKSAKVMLVVGTTEENFNAPWVKNEWSRYIEMMRENKNKYLIPVYSKIDAYKIPEEFAIYQAQSMDKVGAMQDLIRGIDKLMENSKKAKDIEVDINAVDKIRQALDDARVLDNGMYEITVIKESLPVWFYVIQLIALFFLFIAYLALYIISNQNHFYIFFFSGLFFFLSILCSIKRLTFKYRSILLISSLLLLFIYLNIKFPFILLFSKSMFSIITNNSIILQFAFMGIIIQIVVLLLNPTWRLNSSIKAIMNEEQKNKQFIKNRSLKDNFKPKEKPLKKIILMMLVISVLGIISYDCWMRYSKTQSNERNTAVNQVKIKVDFVPIYRARNIYNDKGFSDANKFLGYAYQGEIYTVVDMFEIDDGIWYNIKTEKGLKGYLFLGNDHNDIEYLEKEE